MVCVAGGSEALGSGGKFAMESVAALPWNRWQLSCGISGNFRAEYALVLFTPTARDRKYVWMEIGMFMGARKRIVGALYGVTKEEIATDPSTPVALKRIDSVDLNEIDSYFAELKVRVENWGKRHG